jgi:hypothetical protein
MIKTIILSLFVLAHPVHVSFMSVEYSEKSDVFNVFLKINSDDFALDYKLLSGDTARIDFVANRDKTTTLIGNYINEKVEIFARGQKLNSKMANYNLIDGELKIDLIFLNKAKSKNFMVRNRILTDLYNDQSNLLIFRYGDYEEGIKLTREIQERVFKVK